MLPGQKLRLAESCVDTSALRGRALDGWDNRPLGMKVPWGVFPEEGGAVQSSKCHFLCVAV